MDDNERRYPANNGMRRKEEPEAARPRVQKVIKGEAKVKKPLGRRILDTIRGDDAQTVGQYILFDVVIPSVKDLIVDAGKEALERAFFGGSSSGYRGGRRYGSGGGSSYSYGGNRTSYGNRYNSGGNRATNSRDEDQRPLSRRARSQHDFEEIVLETSGDAHNTLEAMRSAVEQFGSVSVADLYDMVEITHDDYMDRSMGWTDLRDASVRRLRSDAYIIDLPPTERLE